jgi:hypothetical protein
MGFRYCLSEAVGWAPALEFLLGPFLSAATFFFLKKTRGILQKQ